MGLLSLSNPYILAAKVLGCVVVIAIVFGLGYREAVVHQEAANERAMSAQAAEYQKQLLAYASKIDKLNADAAAAARAHQEAEAALNGKVVDLKKEIANAQLDRGTGKGTDGGAVVVDLGSHPFNSDFVRLYDGAVRIANGESAGSVPASPTGTAEAPGAITNVTREELLDTHAEAMRICGNWRKQLNDIIDWTEKHHGP